MLLNHFVELLNQYCVQGYHFLLIRYQFGCKWFNKSKTVFSLVAMLYCLIKKFNKIIAQSPLGLTPFIEKHDIKTF